MAEKPCRHRPAELCIHKLLTYEEWADVRVAADPDSSVGFWEVRRLYLSDCGDYTRRPEVASKQRAAMRGRGAVVRGRGDGRRYLGARLTSEIADSGYRVRPVSVGEPEGNPREALLALARQGLACDGLALDRAYRELTGCPVYLCRVCGGGTYRQAGVHAVCES